ncbi:MAG: recR [Candidatus Taylorbacteria bacterium]|nr:recR [Candidatus Taylorbacteria bacterium]
MDPISRLAEYFRDFPGIGPRQAKRFVYYLLTRNAGTLDEISRLILEIKKQVHICSRCFRFFNAQNAAVGNVCPICADKDRDQSILMVVSKDADFEAIEKAHVHHGLYFILGGTVPILEKNPEQRIRSRELMNRLSDDVSIKELVLSLSATPDGEHTADVIRSLAKDIVAERSIRVTVLGRGLSTGSELEYADSDTIKSAFNNRI